MVQQSSSRTAALCGVLFALGLFAAAGDGGFSPARAVIASIALTLAIPFLCHLGRVLRASADRAGPWADVAVAAGVAGIGLKLASGVPDLAAHHLSLAASTPTERALSALAEATTLVSLFPLAVCCGATAVAVLRGGALPSWLGVGAAVTAVALVVNGAAVGSEFVPAMLLFLLWTLVTSGYLFWAGRRTRVIDPARSATSAG